MRGLIVPEKLKLFANRVRAREISVREADNIANELNIDLVEITGERGKIGALASIAFLREEPSCLMNPEINLQVNSL